MAFLFRSLSVSDLAFWFNTPFTALSHPTHWLTVVIVVSLPALREVVWKTWKQNYSDALMHEVRQMESKGKSFTRGDVNLKLLSHGGHSLRYYAPHDHSQGTLAFWTGTLQQYRKK